MRPRKWRVRCSRGAASARPSGRSSGARGSRSGGMRRTSRPPIPLPSGRLCTKPVRSESGKRRWRPAAPRGRCGSKCRRTTMWQRWPGILPPGDGGSARAAGTSSSGRTAKTTLRAWRGSSPVTAALMGVRPSGSGGLIYIHPGVTVAPALVAAFLDPGRLSVLRPAVRAGGPGISMAARKKHTPEQVVRKLAAADRKPPPRHVHDLDRRRARPGLYRPGIRPRPALRATVSAQFQLSRPAN